MTKNNAKIKNICAKCILKFYTLNDTIHEFKIKNIILIGGQ